MTPSPLPIELALRARLRGTRPDAGGGVRLALAAVALLAVLAGGAGLYVALVLAPRQRPLIVTRVTLSFVGMLLTMSLLPVVQPLARFSRIAPAHWPLSARARGVAELTYALPDFWTALGAALVAAAALTVPAGAVLPVLLSGACGLVSLMAWCLLLQFVLEWCVRRAVLRIAAAVVAIGTVMATVETAGSTGGALAQALPLLAFAAIAAAPLSAAASWAQATIALLHAAGSVALLIGAYGAGFWAWRERQNAAGGDAPASPARALASLAAAAGLPAGVSAAFVQHAAYLLRCPRFWFLLPYGTAFGLVFVHRFAAQWTPSARVFALTLWTVAGSWIFLYNAFAFERRAIWQWFALPLTVRDVLAGKNAAVFLLAVPALAVNVVVALTYLRGGVPLAIASGLLFAYFLFCHAAAGNIASIAFPTPISLRALSQTFITAQAGLVLLVTVGVVTTLAAAAWWWATPGGTSAIAAAQAALTIAAAVAYRAVLFRTTRTADVGRERLAEGVAI